MLFVCLTSEENDLKRRIYHEKTTDHHGNIVQGENPYMQVWTSKMNSYSRRDKWPEDIDEFGGIAARSKTYSKEMKGVYSFSTALSIGVDSLGDLVPIMVEAGHMYIVMLFWNMIMV